MTGYGVNAHYSMNVLHKHVDYHTSCCVYSVSGLKETGGIELHGQKFKKDLPFLNCLFSAQINTPIIMININTAPPITSEVSSGPSGNTAIFRVSQKNRLYNIYMIRCVSDRFGNATPTPHPHHEVYTGPATSRRASGARHKQLA
jgi:hypothetical protein